MLLRRADLKDLYHVVYEGRDGAPPWKRLLAALDDTSFRIRYRQLSSRILAVTRLDCSQWRTLAAALNAQQDSNITATCVNVYTPPASGA